MSFLKGFKLFAVVIIAGGVLNQSPVFAQSDRPTGQPSGRERGQMRERMFDADPDVLRARLERRLEFIRRQQEELETALAELDARAAQKGDHNADDHATLDERPRRGNTRERFRPDRATDRQRGSRDVPEDRRKNIELVLKFLEENNPEIAQRVKEAVRKNPRMAEGLIGRLSPRIDEIRALGRRDPEMARLRTAELTNGWVLMHTSRKLREAYFAEPRDRKSVETIHQKIKEHVTKQFEIRTRIHLHEIETLQKRIEQARDSIEEMMTKRDEVIAEHVDRIIDEAQTSDKGRRGRRNP